MKKEIIVALIIGMCIGSTLTLIVDESDKSRASKEHNTRMQDVAYYQALTRLEGSIEIQEIYKWSQKERSEVDFYPVNHKDEQ
jgi:hypothetical protein